ncbi:MAG: DNRLRE domain-containing protein, partial [bacterium]
FGVPLAGEIEGGVFDDVNIDNRGGEFTPDPGDARSLLFAEKAGVPGAPVGVYDHLGYLMGAGFMGNPLCHAAAYPGDCPPGEDPVQKPEMERRFAPGVHIYAGNDPTLPGFCPNYLPLILPYTFGQGKFKFEADWSLVPTATAPFTFGCNQDPLILFTEPTIIVPGAPPAQVLGRTGAKGKNTKLAASPPVILAPGDTYRIQGFNFGDAQGYQTVSLAGQPLDVLEWTDNYIDVEIPSDAISGPLLVATTTGLSNALMVEINYRSSRASYMRKRSVYVDASNSGPEDGSKANPWNTIQEAVNNLPNRTPRYIFVAPGTYNERVKIDKNHVHLIGSGPHETTINGLPERMQIQHQGEGGGAGPTIFIGKGGIHGAKSDIRVCGFTITGGTVLEEIGAGIFCDYGNSDLDINNNIIFRNGGYYGGGIWLHYSNHNVKIWSNVIAENGNFGGYGGGISVNDEPEYSEEHGQPEHVWDDYNPGPPPGTYEIYNNILFHNWSADYGGAVCLYEIKDHLKVYGNVMMENKAEDHGGAMFLEDSGPADIYGNVFLRNWTPDDGGAISFEDIADTLSHINVYNNLFAENIADDHGENHARGAALALDDIRDAKIFNNTIVGNMVMGSFDPAGGGIDSERHGHEYIAEKPDGSVYMPPGYSDPMIFNNIIWGNWRVNYQQPVEGGEEEDLDYTWAKNYVWTPDQLHVDNPHVQPEWLSEQNSNSFSQVAFNNIMGGYDYNNQPPTADAGANQALKDLDNSGSEPVTLDGSGSSDSDGSIVSYTWTENGAPLATGVNPTVELAIGSHTILLKVFDERGASSTDVVSVTVNAITPTTVSFIPTDDSYVRSNRKLNNYGRRRDLRVRNSSTTFHSFLKFDVTGLSGSILNAKVRLKVRNGSKDGGSIYAVTNDWNEDNVTWESAPQFPGSSLSSAGKISSGDMVEFDVSSAISGNGTYSFGLKNNSSDIAKFSSKEGSTPPELIIETSSGGGGNTPPIADAGADQTVTDSDNSDDEMVTLDGSGSYDSDGTIMSYDWSESGSTIATGSVPTVNLAVGVHTIVLTVSDDHGATAADQVVVTVNAGGGANTPPVADAGPDQTVTDSDNSGAEIVSLDGSDSYDTDGSIVSYDWSEGGLVFATGITPSVSLTVGTHNITLTVADNQGATGTDQVIITVNAGGGGTPGTFTFNPTDDAFARSDKSSKNYGGSSQLRLRKTSSKEMHAYLMFAVNGLSGNVTSARLRLKVVSASDDGGSIYSIASSWDEGSLNWNNAPAIGGSPLSSVGAVAKGDIVEFDVSTAITGDGVYSFGIKNASSDAAKYSSKEGSTAPELIIETSSPAPHLAIASDGTLSFTNWLSMSTKIRSLFMRELKNTAKTQVHQKRAKSLFQMSGNNLNFDPMFVDPANLNWRLQPGSPVIDQADASIGPGIDLERLPRSVVNGMIDMGAFEWRANSPMVMRIPTGVLGQFKIPTPGSSQLYP